MAGIPARNWAAMMLSPPYDFVVGDFEPQSLELGIGGEWIAVSALNQDEPFQRFLHGKPSTIRFSATFHDATAAHSHVMEKLGVLESFARKNESLGRPPTLLLMIGSDLLFENVILQNMPISFSGLTLFGSVRTASVGLEFGIMVAYSGPKSPGTGGFTQRYIAKTFDSFESIALERYGNPMLGVWLRRLNPGFTELLEGDSIFVPEKEVAVKQIIEPKSVALNQRDDAALKLRDAKFDARSTTRRTFVLTNGS